MRPALPHPLRERRSPRRTRRGRSARSAPRQPDTAVQRAREAGGPVDRASYACQCGYMFVAAVSTTVDCPHCHATQAW